MQKKIQLQVSHKTAVDPVLLREEVAAALPAEERRGFLFRVLKRSTDARGRKIRINLTIEVAVNEALPEQEISFDYLQVAESKKVCHIIGAGPAGLFAALRCLELGIKPVLLERGKDVKARRRDLAAINKEQLVNPESNYCFGEGGAGTYSDGKLYTRSNKRGDIEKVLKTLVFHGASQNILVEAHPHIGTNKLPQLIQKIRETILAHGGEMHFNTRLKDFEIEKGMVKGIRVEHEGRETEWPVQQLILATGHSARDIYYLLKEKEVQLEAKPFALGLRVEHPQELIDSIQYHCSPGRELEELRHYLPAASYSLVQQVNGKGVYSFCMCPGGIIAPCATSQEEIVTNGWSPSKRNNPFANSGIVVGLDQKDFLPFAKHGPLAGLELQKHYERQAWVHGGKTQTAPAQRLVDFTQKKRSADLPDCSYQPGIHSVEMRNVLGDKLCEFLTAGFKSFGSKMRGYLSNEAVVVGVESRTSTPVRIPRNDDTLTHPQLGNLYPCGEGAGYAGGIVSAAMDGERCANHLKF